MTTVAVALLVGVGAAAVPAGPAYAATWSAVASPNGSTGANLFVGVDARSATDVWAVGRAEHSSQPGQRPLVARWNGTSWALVGNPALSGDGSLQGVHGSASNNVWAVGTRAGANQLGTPLTERWNGSAWSVVSSPTPAGATGANLEGVKTFSATSAWAVGNYTASTAPHARTMIQRWNGTGWTIVPSPSPDPSVNLLSDVDGVSPTDAWAIGNLGNDGYGTTIAGMVLRLINGTWSQVAVPGLNSDSTLRSPVLQDIVTIASNDVWIVGRAFHLGLFRMVPIHLHWNGTGWTRGFVPNAPSDGFSGVTALAANRVYAVGGSMIAKWNGSTWALETTSVAGALTDAAAIGPGTVWTAGYRHNPATFQLATLTVRATNG